MAKAAAPEPTGGGGLVDTSVGSATEHSSSGYGAIAQLGERVLCKHEVVGSIPSGSTSLRRLRLLRLGEPDDGEDWRVVARRAKTGWRLELDIASAKTSLRMRSSHQGFVMRDF
jgi:hypothetical protein